jgi:hypothetical protein
LNAGDWKESMKSKHEDKSLVLEAQGVLAALRRAGRNARKLSEATGAPFIVWKNGRIVDLNPQKKRRAKR